MIETSVALSSQPATPTPANRDASGGRDASLYQFFAPGGVLSRTHPAYEFRRGQLQMAQAVEQALAEKRHLIVEAGTGTGKTLAYLMPVIRSGKRVIISTGTKNLQEQLFYKDVPFLEQALYAGGEQQISRSARNDKGTAGRDKEAAGRLSVCYMKGRNNYLCRKKLYELTDQPVLSGLEEIEQYRAIAAWEKTTSTGDRAELAELPEASLLWHKLDARADACIGQKCSEWERCFVTEMRRKAMESDIIIVNHHLFFADLAIKLQADGAPDAGVLPEAAVVIFDEAHELEDVAGNYFGISVSNLRMEELARDVENSLQHHRMMSASLSGAVGSLRERSQFFFSLLPPGDGRFAFETRREFLEENGDEFVALNQALTRLAGELEGLPQKPEEVFNFVRRAQEIQVQLGFAMESEDRNTVFWIERRGGRFGGRGGAGKAAESGRGRQNVFLQATPIDVGPILRECLWSKLECAVLTSATLAVGGGFEYIRQRLGMEHAREAVLPSHFDYESQALLYVPPDLPDPRTPQFTVKAAERIRKLLEITRGRAFVLFTSYAQMNDIYQRLLGEVEFPMLRQGDAPKTALLEEFRLTPNAVLFATSSFWQGVDVQGEQLSCVIIDRLPFAVPSDPVVAARVKAIDADGGNAFFQYQVPAAVITLKQGFGRLIRSLHDRGLLVLLDNRILKKQYGRVFVESLPNYKKTTEMRVVEGFFGVGE
ncbi:MAG TPA: ATP-dependent DNA helicase [Candidatus Sulfotelmatobacter sp.]|nr:ATP-dependent DNA helicase [Candidatus Sulfotelmatobacter sp.]